MDILNQRVNRSRGSRRAAIITAVLALALLLPISMSGLWSDATSQTEDKVEQEKKAADYEKKAEWDAMTDEQKKAYKAQQKAEWEAMTPEQKSDDMMKKVCTAENSAACIVGKKMKAHGVDAGLNACQKMQQAEEGKYVFKEKEFNSLGYAFLYVEKTDEAIAVLELNVKQYPDSWNCYDSLGEAYMVAKRYDKASQNYQLAVNMNPEGQHSKDQLEKLQTLMAGTN